MRAKRTQLQKRYALETKTYDRILFRVARTFVPNTTICFQQVRVFGSEPVKTWTTQTVFSFDDKPQRHRKFAKRFLIRFDCGKTCEEISFAVCGATRVQLPILNC